MQITAFIVRRCECQNSLDEDCTEFLNTYHAFATIDDAEDFIKESKRQRCHAEIHLPTRGRMIAESLLSTTSKENAIRIICYNLTRAAMGEIRIDVAATLAAKEYLAADTSPSRSRH